MKVIEKTFSWFSKAAFYSSTAPQFQLLLAGSENPTVLAVCHGFANVFIR